MRRLGLLTLSGVCGASCVILAACGGASGSSDPFPVADSGIDTTGDSASDVEDMSPDTLPSFDTTPPDGGGCTPACGPGFFCFGGICAPEQPPCTKDDECQNDTYCDKATGKCVPYGAPGKTSNPDCASVVPTGLFAPAIHCEFKKAPAGDPNAAFLNVLATPMVATFEKGGMPSIVAPFYDGIDGSSEQNGILRVLSGKDCSQLANLSKVDGDPSLVSASSSVAIGDLDGDGLPEIIAYSKPATGGGGVIAFTKKADRWSVLWRAKNPDGSLWTEAAGSQWAGPSIHDLDDDGKPEVLREGFVFDSTGKLIATQPPGWTSGYGTRLFAVVADLDGDGKVELTNGAAVWSFDPTTKKWVTKFASTGVPAGLAALADFGTSSVDGVFDGKAEIAVVFKGTVNVVSDGKKVWGPIALPGSAGGGPPTIADFDGDGQPEIAVAGSDSYTVIDPDCLGATVRPGGKCLSGRTDGILWSKKSQDNSSNITGSSVFDFDADGIAEAVYADECFARVYSGDTGDVIFSQYMSSCTWYENPVVADVNLDDRAELIVPSNLNCGSGTDGIGCSGSLTYPDSSRPGVGVDAVFAGLRCKSAGDCLSGTCDAGYCRCTKDSECCAGGTDASCLETGFICMPPPTGTKGTGKTCRAAHPHGFAGIRVYRDFADRWVRSRPIWNQHAYSVTNVNDDGTIPKTSEWIANWKAKDPRLNDYRKNTPGTKDPLKSPDLTTRASTSVCRDGKLTLSATVCNRGASKAADNYSVTFYEGLGADPTKVICTAKTDLPLDVAECKTLSCEWATPPRSESKDVFVLVDPSGLVRQCNKNNKSGFIKGVRCSGPA